MAYWHSVWPTMVLAPPTVSKRLPVPRSPQGVWLNEKRIQCPGSPVQVAAEMRRKKREWAKKGR